MSPGRAGRAAPVARLARPITQHAGDVVDGERGPAVDRGAPASGRRTTAIAWSSPRVRAPAGPGRAAGRPAVTRPGRRPAATRGEQVVGRRVGPGRHHLAPEPPREAPRQARASAGRRLAGREEQDERGGPWRTPACTRPGGPHQRLAHDRIGGTSTREATSHGGRSAEPAVHRPRLVHAGADLSPTSRGSTPTSPSSAPRPTRARRGSPAPRFAPRKIRELSVKYAGYGPIQNQKGYYDIEEDRRYLEYERQHNRIVDCGDSDIVYTNVRRTFDNITADVRADPARPGAFPVVIGGDHAVTYPVVRAYEERLNVVHFDAHLDYRPFVHGVQWANGNPIRNVAQLKTCHHIIQVGIRSLRTSQSDVADSRARGNDIVTVPGAPAARRQGHRRPPARGRAGLRLDRHRRAGPAARARLRRPRSRTGSPTTSCARRSSRSPRAAR